MLRRRVLVSVLVPIALGLVLYLVFGRSTTELSVNPAPAPGSTVQTIPAVAVTTTTPAPTTAAAVPVTTAAVASTTTSIPDINEVNCASQYTDWIYNSKFGCRPVDIHGWDLNNEFTPTHGFVSIDENSSLPGAGLITYAAGHVNQRDGVNVFERLPELVIGDVIAISVDGGLHRYVVSEERIQWDKDHTSEKAQPIINELARSHATPELWLVTCGGVLDVQKRSYDDNVVIRAKLLS